MTLVNPEDLEADAFNKVAIALIAEVNASMTKAVAQAKVRDATVFISRCRAKYHEAFASALESSNDFEYAEQVANATLDEEALEEIRQRTLEIVAIRDQFIERATFLASAVDDANNALEAWQSEP